MHEDVSRRVPLYIKPADSPYCGAASTRMVAAYHGIDRSLTRLVREMGVRSYGIHNVNVGLWFLHQGFGAKIISVDEDLPPNFQAFGPSDIVHGNRVALNDSNLRHGGRKVYPADAILYAFYFRE